MDNTLTFEEKQFIISSLNDTFHSANEKLKHQNLGDVERKYLEQTVEMSKELIVKMAL